MLEIYIHLNYLEYLLMKKFNRNHEQILRFNILIYILNTFRLVSRLDNMLLLKYIENNEHFSNKKKEINVSQICSLLKLNLITDNV